MKGESMKYESIKQGSVKHDTIDGHSVTIENGIAFFDEPYLVNDVHFAYEHRKRDFIIRPVNSGDDVYAIAVPLLPVDNDMLYQMFKAKDLGSQGCIIMQGIYEEEGVLYID